MNKMDKDIKARLKRKRKKRNNKRWTDNEIKQLVQYVQEQQEFEKPTAQIFYRKFLRLSNMDATWDLCRWKIKYLRTTYTKAEIWRKSNGLLENDPAVQDKLRKMCRFYDELHGVFAQQISYMPDDSTNISLNNRATAGESTVDDSIDEYLLASVKTEENEDHSTLLVPLRSTTCSPVPSLAASFESGHLTPTENTLLTKASTQLKTTAELPTSSLNSNFLVQNERNSLLKMRFEFEKEKFQKEFELKERKLNEEIKERRENFELKKLEMAKDERLRVLELEKQERIERFEIEMRYSCKRQRLNQSQQTLSPTFEV